MPSQATRNLDRKVANVVAIMNDIGANLDRLSRHLDHLGERAEDRLFTIRAARQADAMSFDRRWNDNVERQRAKNAEIQANADAFYKRNGK